MRTMIKVEQGEKESVEKEQQPLVAGTVNPNGQRQHDREIIL